MNIEKLFRDAMLSHGFTPPSEIIADGAVHRFAINGERGGKKSGAYRLYGDGRPAGWFQNHKGGTGLVKWVADGRVGAMSVEEWREHRREMLSRQQRRTEETERQHQVAARRAQDALNAADGDAGGHPYALKKRVPLGPLVRRGAWAQNGWADALLVPLFDLDGTVWSVEAISADGEKMYLAGARKTGCFHPFGRIRGASRVLVGEGLATVAACVHATGLPGAAAMDCGNLPAVAAAVRRIAPDAEIVMLADNDVGSGVNPGVSKATEAAVVVKGRVAVPDLNGSKCDWWDVYEVQGEEAVRAGVAQAQEVRSDIVEASATDGSARKMVGLLRADEIPMEPVSWLWDGWLAAGKLHILAGAPGTGKTTISMALAASLSSGNPWPDGAQCEGGSVVIWTGEDDPRDTLVPRLAANGANLSRVHFVGDIKEERGPRAFDPAKDMDALRHTCESLPDLRLMILDPIVNAVGAADSHKNTEVRTALAPVVRLAADLDVAVLGISHFTKGTQGRDPVERVTGSLAFGALARVVLVAAKVKRGDGTDHRIFARAKSNIGPDDGGFAYGLELVSVADGVEGCRVSWDGSVPGTARELLADVESAAEGDGETRTAVAWLSDLLHAEALWVSKVKEAATEAGIPWRTVQRAASKVPVKRLHTGFGKPMKWSLRCNATAVAPSAPDTTLGADGATNGVHDARILGA
jgi:putative DNA primase/helicase